MLLSQAVSLNLEYEIIGRSYYLPNKGTVLDIGFGKEVALNSFSAYPLSPSQAHSQAPKLLLQLLAGVDRAILLSPPPWLEGRGSAPHPQRGREQQARHQGAPPHQGAQQLHLTGYTKTHLASFISPSFTHYHSDPLGS